MEEVRGNIDGRSVCGRTGLGFGVFGALGPNNM